MGSITKITKMQRKRVIRIKKGKKINVLITKMNQIQNCSNLNNKMKIKVKMKELK